MRLLPLSLCSSTPRFRRAQLTSLHTFKIGCSQSSETPVTAAAPKPKMDFDKVKNGVAAGEFVLVDVRGKGEWDAGHIPGAKLLPRMSQRYYFDPLLGQ